MGGGEGVRLVGGGPVFLAFPVIVVGASRVLWHARDLAINPDDVEVIFLVVESLCLLEVLQAGGDEVGDPDSARSKLKCGEVSKGLRRGGFTALTVRDEGGGVTLLEGL